MVARAPLPPVPEGAVAMGARQLAAHLGVSRATAYRILGRLQATRDPDALPLGQVDVRTGKGATRRCVAVLWPVVDQGGER